ncbi:hypothetical protein [Hoeflea ulvae]|uniref:Prealbumin-like fold domain-containing protein n=1 Tax=Hoeflea ulvae TaxID=2983764 RepID=A0ABT3YHH7_9HYPH|nr:hypothetical protein [Hoeflea ulvae]MCY0095072.1 hypothetical protein [Hoeflea ulvae]
MAEQLTVATGAVTIKPTDNTTSVETPAVGFPLKVQGPEGVSVVYTDDEGKWSLYNLPAGQYSVKPIAELNEHSSTTVAEFSVKEASFFDRFIGSETRPVIASDIQLSTDSIMNSKTFILEK